MNLALAPRRFAVCAALLAGGGAPSAGAQPLFSHLRIIAPAAPGGGWDQTARAMQQALQGSDIVESASVENIPGAAGTIGLAHLIGAERGRNDVTMISGLIMLAAIRSNRSPVTLDDVTPIARLTGEYEAIVVPAASPYRTLPSLLEAFRVRPESISWAGGSAGGTDQILAGLVADAVGVSPRRVNYVAFAGGGEAIAAVLGGQVTAGISGLAEFAPQIAAGTLRILAISSDERLADVAAPTLREQGVNVVLENWRSLIGPSAMSGEDRSRLERAVAAMVTSPAWQQSLRRYQWNDRYLAGPAFARFVADEQARVQSILDKLGVRETPSAAARLYPRAVTAGWIVTLLAFAVSRVAARRGRGATWGPPPPATADHRQLSRARTTILLALALGVNVLLIERAGFVLASIPLFWLTARSFDNQHPIRDAAVASALSIGAYVIFARVLQIPLPAGVLARWL